MFPANIERNIIISYLKLQVIPCLMSFAGMPPMSVFGWPCFFVTTAPFATTHPSGIVTFLLIRTWDVTQTCGPIKIGRTRMFSCCQHKLDVHRYRLFHYSSQTKHYPIWLFSRNIAKPSFY